ncbi:MAG: HepT-like ribonuclease domain-containing protein [Bacteroidota bacterium]
MKEVEKVFRKCLGVWSKLFFEYHLATFSNSPMIVDVVERRIGIIGEAASKLAKLSLYLSATDSLINRRNTIIHQYDDFSHRALWRHIKEDLPSVLTEVAELLEQPEIEE